MKDLRGIWFKLVLISTIMAACDALKTLQIDGDNGSPTTAFPLPECSGDCDSNADCFGDLTCQQRSGTTLVPGCDGTPVGDKDYCIKANGQNALAYTGDDAKPLRSFPLGNCEGDCDSNFDCAPGLTCFQRSGTQTVPGCTGTGVSGKDYCYYAASTPTLKPTSSPTPAPTAVIAPSPTFNPTTKAPTAASAPTAAPTTAQTTARPTSTAGPTYIPGHLNVTKLGLKLSWGLDAKIIATENQKVVYANGVQSTVNFHVDPDGAAVFLKNDGSGNYFYVSNSEEAASSTGGVGSIEFDKNGNILGYKRVLTGTSNNCGGGRSPYNTWLSAEENGSSGYVWETSPQNAFVGRKTNLVPYGGNFESVAFHYDSSLARNIYYITDDSTTGPLIQFSPSANFGSREEMYSTGTHKYLRVASGTSGAFSWESTKAAGTPSLYPNAKGIDVKDGFLYFVSKTDKTLFILNLNQMTFTKESTVRGAFANQPDQVARIVGTDPLNILYFCEDGGTYCGVHGRDPTGRYFTVIDSDGTGTITAETTGLAFSPDNKRMYVSFQGPGKVFEVWRTDGYPFSGAVVDIKYHALVTRRL